uniref:C4-dicarboxylate transporter DcuC n=1 Tax=Streptococcus merionis TaxID=400065 RepID=UPI0026F15739
METIFVFLISALSLFAISYMLIKKHDIKISLFAIGLILLYVAQLLGHPILEKPSHFLLDPITVIVNQLGDTLSGAGLVILILGGYSAYMTAIGANDMTVRMLTKPLVHIKSPYILVPVVFLLGNLLSLVIPSASNLAIILIATLFPVLRKSGMSNLTAAAVIATTATIMPTPLGSDNVAVAEALGISVSEYVFSSHAIISIPTLFVMALVHMVWQKYCDSKEKNMATIEISETQEAVKSFSVLYAILPLLPILILLASFILNLFGIVLSLTVVSVTIISFIITLFIELLRNKETKETLAKSDKFFKGMGSAIDIVMLLVAASTFVNGLKGIGLITILQETMTKTSSSGVLLPIILVIFSAIIVLLSGSGT